MVKVKLLMPFRGQSAGSVTEMSYDDALMFTEAGVVEIIEDPVEAADEIVGNVEKITYEPPAVEPDPEPVPEPEPEMTIEDDGTVSSYTAPPLDDDDDAEGSLFDADDDI